jgi:endonuclease III related protein
VSHYAGSGAGVSTVPPRFYNGVVAHAALARPADHGAADVYERLRRHRGPAGWWPAETPFEVCVGAILVQNTAWANVEKALSSLRAAGRLSYEGLAGIGRHELAALIRPSGCYNVKARRLAAFVDFLGREYGGRVEAMAVRDPRFVRAQLLAVPGIGRETADSIALYAAGLPLFVIDAYTRRVFGRLGMIRGDESYDALQDYFMTELGADAGLFNDYHAQIVMHAKDVCRPRPCCARCPLDSICPRVGLRV